MQPPIAYLTSALLLSPGTLEHFARDLRYLWAVTQTHPSLEIPSLLQQYWTECYPDDSYGSNHSLRLIAAYDYVLQHQHELLVSPIQQISPEATSQLSDKLVAALHRVFSKRPLGLMFSPLSAASLIAMMETTPLPAGGIDGVGAALAECA